MSRPESMMKNLCCLHGFPPLIRTDSSAATSSIQAFERGVGTHFIVDKDGTVTQTASLHKRTNHVGIEVVAKHRDGTWEALTLAQSASISAIAKILKNTHNIKEDDIYEHDKFHTRRPVRALFPTTALIVTTACHPVSRPPSSDSAPALEIKQISPSKFHATKSDDKDDALAAACAKWQLTKEQARHFFQVSQTYKDSPYSEFYQLPCSIDGIIEAEGKTWEFTINAGATAVWRNDNEVRYFGCSDPACEPLVLMMPDGMNP